MCDESDSRIIHIDHKLGQGYLEKEYFKKKEDMLQFYLNNFETESKYLQPLCFNCNTKKRIENKEQRGRPNLQYYYDIIKKSNIQNIEECESHLEEFLSDHPQFIPIHDRFVPVLIMILENEKIRREYVQSRTKLNEKLKSLPENGFIKSVKSYNFDDFTEAGLVITSAKIDVLGPQILQYVKTKQQESNSPVDFVYIHAEFIDEGPWSLNDIRDVVYGLLRQKKLLKINKQEFVVI